MTTNIKELRDLNSNVYHVISAIIIPNLEKHGEFSWNTKYTHFKVISIVTVMLSNLNMRFTWLDEDTLLISVV